ncbi:hypothetical protein [Streptomyces flaveolus]|uniref:hypothetical protein n=1 Tax=Streptomyces flaveolus TaxID=67297 RepID=UPI0036FEC4DB
MDAKNRFETKTTFALTRLEWLGILAVSLVLAFQHRTGIRWGVFALLFAVIDVVGYRSASDSEGNGTPRTSVEDTDAVRA